MIFDDMPRIDKEFNEEISKMVVSGTTGILIGAATYEVIDKVHGKSEELKRLEDEWKLKDGKTELEYNTKDHFQTGYLIREPIYRGLRFKVCQEDSETERKRFTKDIKDKELGMDVLGFLSVDLSHTNAINVYV